MWRWEPDPRTGVARAQPGHSDPLGPLQVSGTSERKRYHLASVKGPQSEAQASPFPSQATLSLPLVLPIPLASLPLSLRLACDIGSPWTWLGPATQPLITVPGKDNLIGSVQPIAWVLLDWGSISGPILCDLGQGHLVQKHCLGPPLSRVVARRAPKRQEGSRHPRHFLHRGPPPEPSPPTLQLPLPPLLLCPAQGLTNTSPGASRACSLGQKGLALHLRVHQLDGEGLRRRSLEGHHQDIISRSWGLNAHCLQSTKTLEPDPALGVGSYWP